MILTAVSVVVFACSSDLAKMVGATMADAGKSLADAGEALKDSGAHAQCDTCTVSQSVELAEPVTIVAAQPLVVVTAETDDKQLVGGLIPVAAEWEELAAGPVVITDLLQPTGDAGGHTDLAMADPGKCASSRTPVARIMTNGINGLTAMRILIPEDKVLCGSGTKQGRWSGFRPYR